MIEKCLGVLFFFISSLNHKLLAFYHRLIYNIVKNVHWKFCTQTEMYIFYRKMTIYSHFSTESTFLFGYNMLFI